MIGTGSGPDKGGGRNLIGVAVTGDGADALLRQQQKLFCGVGMDLPVPVILSGENRGHKRGIVGISLAGK